MIERALAKEAAQRYPSAGDLGRAARAALGGTDPSQPERSLATGPAAPHRHRAVAGPRLAPPTATRRRARCCRRLTTAGQRAAAAPAASPRALGARPSAPDCPIARARGRCLRRAGVAVAGVLAAAGVFSGGDEGGSPSDGGRSPGEVTKPTVVATNIPAGNGPDGITVTATPFGWPTPREALVTRLDARTNKLAGRPVRVGQNPDSVAVTDGVVWVTNTDDGTVSRIEGGSASVVPVGPGPEGLSARAGCSGWRTATGTA